MIAAIPVAWLQLRHEKLRLLIALSGVAFAVILIFMQLGFQSALFDSAVRYHTKLDYDLAMISPKTDFIVQPEAFTRRRLYQALGVDGVEAVSPIYLGQARWRNPVAPAETRTIYVLGFNPEHDILSLPGIAERREDLRRSDVVLYDALSRPEFGPVAELVRRDGALETEVGTRAVSVVGLFELGTSFGIDASLVTSDLNFRRMFPERPAGLINLGLLRLEPGADPEVVRRAIIDRVPGDVEVLTRAGFIQRELDYWNGNTPIGYVFSFGVVIGLTVGCIIVYQILFADVSDHLQEYATLKAMGYTNGFLSRLVIQEAFILAVLGYLPGLALVLWLYRSAGAATRLPIEMTIERGVLVLVLTVAMCSISGTLALRKVRAADPADVF